MTAASDGRERGAVRAHVPRLIHQTWKDDAVPARWRDCQASWRRHHRGWRYRLWTDADNRAFLAEHDAWFLPIYDGYAEPIMRADAVRYFLMYRLGGVYADLDLECRRPLGPLLDGHEVVLGLEPEEHVERQLARGRDLARLVCNAFLASRPGHPFWEHVIRELVASHRAPGVLDATGPFMLTAAVESYPGRDAPFIAPAQLVYPLPAASSGVGGRDGESLDLDEAYTVHHWAGSWVRDPDWSPRTRGTSQVAFRLTDRVRPVIDGVLDVDEARRLWRAGRDRPLVSCLMVTARRAELAWRSVQCFRVQTYAPCELLVVDDDPDPTLRDRLAALGDSRIRHLSVAPGDTPLGALRNIGVSHARGELLAQWDDDDLHDPERIEVQVAALETLAADVCLLRREQLWWPGRRITAISGARPWEGSMLARRPALGACPYPTRRRGEDTALVTRLLRSGRAAVVDAPWLYVYVFHGDNTFDAAHFSELFAAADAVAEGGDYVQAMLALAARLPIDLEPVLAGAAPTPHPPAHGS